MCWKRYEPDPQPSPTPMAVFVSPTEGFQSINATEGGSACPDLAKECSNNTWFDCHKGICCEHIVHGDTFCSCFPGWEGDLECDIQKVDLHANSDPVLRPPDVLPTGIQISPIFLQVDQAKGMAEASSPQIVLIGVVVTIVLVGLLTIAFIVYRKLSRRNQSRPHNQNPTPETSKDLPLSDVKVVTNSASTSLLRSAEDTNVNDKGES